jgi:DNA excision repair protein ERCC-2
LIDYYEKKFKKGWDYGYVFPAITKCLQSAGRCIRSEKDRGVIIFLDERFAWPMYKKYFPPDWKITITKDYSGKIKEFFSQ